jgi:hypothetical protein
MEQEQADTSQEAPDSNVAVSVFNDAHIAQTSESDQNLPSPQANSSLESSSPTSRLISRSLDSKHELEEWVKLPAPPLYQKREVRVQVFGFPFTEDDLCAWADRHDIFPGKRDHVRRDSAWRAIGFRLPLGHRRMSMIRDANGSATTCFVVGSNVTAKDMLLTQNIELIKSIYDAIDMGIRPGWFYLSRGP